MPWLAASRSARRDIGSWTFQSSWRRVAPDAVAASIDRRRHAADPDLDEADDRRRRVDDRGHDRGEAGRPEEGQRRDQVDERGQGLGGVEDRAQDLPEPSWRAVWIADREPDHQRDERADQHVGEGRHRVVPEPEQDDQDEADRRR